MKTNSVVEYTCHSLLGESHRGTKWVVQMDIIHGGDIPELGDASIVKHFTTSF
jgi:hypothetical protein